MMGVNLLIEFATQRDSPGDDACNLACRPARKDLINAVLFYGDH